MARKLIYLSPHFPPNFHHFAVNLATAGVEVYAISDNPSEILHPALRESLADHYQVDTLDRTDQVLAGCEYFIRRHGPVDRVESHIETWLGLEALIRERFNIPGKQVAEINRIKQKSWMKEIFRANGVPCSAGMVVNTEAEATAFAKKVGFPVHLKPDVGVGADGTHKISNKNELKALFANSAGRPQCIEPFVEGHIETFDGLCDQEGQIVFCGSLKYSHGVREVVERNLNFFYSTQRQIPQDVEEAGRKCVALFDIREKFFHIEFFRTPSGKILAIEVNLRPPGGFTIDMFNFANDIDLYAQWANVVATNRFSARFHYPYHCAHVSRRSGRDYRHSAEEIAHKFHRNICHATSMAPIFARVMGDNVYLVRSPDFREIEAMVAMIHAEN